MEVILKEDVHKLGHKNDIVKVKNGYANNFLFPRGLAILATDSAKKILAENIRQRAHKEAKIVADAQSLAEILSALTLTIPTKVSQTGRIYGSVGSGHIAEALAKEGYEIEKSKISVGENGKISEIGVYEALIDLHKGVEAKVKVTVVDEEGKVLEVAKEEKPKSTPVVKKEEGEMKEGSKKRGKKSEDVTPEEKREEKPEENSN